MTFGAAVMVPALLVMVGLVVDGGGKVTAARQADAAAYSAVRYGGEAAAAEVGAGEAPTAVAAQAARQYLASSGVDGSVSVHAGRVIVDTTASYHTVFLGLVGINTLFGHGEASAFVAGVR